MATPKGTEPWNKGKGKGWINQKGYRCFSVTKNGKRRQIKEHRMIMEQHLGRKLEPWEVVHHKDGNKLNNDISNLEVMEFGQHSFLHNIGETRTETARNRMTAAALMRNEIKDLREINKQMFEALEELCKVVKEQSFHFEHSVAKVWLNAHDVLELARGEESRHADTRGESDAEGGE